MDLPMYDVSLSFPKSPISLVTIKNLVVIFFVTGLRSLTKIKKLISNH